MNSATTAHSVGREPNVVSSRRWWMLLAVSIVLLIATYVLAVLTATGQGLENTALRGADQASPADSDEAWESLGNITIWSLGIATAIIGLIGLLRRKFILAVVGMGVIVGGQVITQALKRFILPRPELVEVTGDYTHNSFPSGHTTIAMTVLVAVLLEIGRASCREGGRVSEEEVGRRAIERWR